VQALDAEDRNSPDESRRPWIERRVDSGPFEKEVKKIEEKKQRKTRKGKKTMGRKSAASHQGFLNRCREGG
jgi:hypothetical protein